VAFGAVVLSFFLKTDEKTIQSKQEITVNAGVPLED
jgi:hypothetical protein